MAGGSGGNPADKKINIVIAIAVTVALVVMAYLAMRGGGRGEGFVSPRAEEVHARATEVFASEKGNPTYSAFKRGVPGADPVLFSDVSKLNKAGNLTPSAVQSVL